jgi:hypothetical protein
MALPRSIGINAVCSWHAAQKECDLAILAILMQVCSSNFVVFKQRLPKLTKSTVRGGIDFSATLLRWRFNIPLSKIYSRPQA